MMLDCSRTRILGWIACLLFVLPNCYSQYSLRKELAQAGIPLTSFSEAELDEAVDGTGASKQPYVYFVYVRRNGNLLTGLPRLVRYDQSTGAILRSELQLKEDDPYCCGSPDGFEFLDDYLLLSFHYNPSAGAILVLDKDLKLLRSLDGFDVQRVAMNQLVIVENMVHFAPVHPERLQWADLSKNIALEIYPLQNDILRNQFSEDYSKQMPAACKKSLELCGYGRFDEGCTYLGGDGQGRFVFQCGRSASYQTKEMKEPVNYASDSAIYIFDHSPNGWVHCEQAISEDEATALDTEGTKGYDKIKSRCTPKLPVIPDDDR